MRTGEISIQAALHRSRLWITLPLRVSDQYNIEFVLDTGSPISAISPQVRSELLANGLLPPGVSARSYRLASVTVQGQAVPDFDVRELPRLARLGVDGLLGLDFLTRFVAIHFHVPTLQLVLEGPEGHNVQGGTVRET